MNEVNYLGHVINKEGIRADIRKFNTIPNDFFTPRNIKEL